MSPASLERRIPMATKNAPRPELKEAGLAGAVGFSATGDGGLDEDEETGSEGGRLTGPGNLAQKPRSRGILFAFSILTCITPRRHRVPPCPKKVLTHLLAMPRGSGSCS